MSGDKWAESYLLDLSFSSKDELLSLENLRRQYIAILLELANRDFPEPRTGAVPLRPLFYFHLGLLYLIGIPKSSRSQDGGSAPATPALNLVRITMA
jgi:hypothetical protein